MFFVSPSPELLAMSARGKIWPHYPEGMEKLYKVVVFLSLAVVGRLTGYGCKNCI
jgi:hypothetical protein